MRFTHAFLLNLVGREVTLIFSVLNTIILGRCLGTAELGTYALFVAAANLIAQVGTLGFQHSNGLLAAREPEKVRLLVTQSFLPVALLASLGGALLIWFPRWTDAVFGELAGESRSYALAGAALIILNLNLGAIFGGLRRYKRFTIVNAVATVGMGLTNLALVGVMKMRMPVPLYVWLAWNAAGIVLAMALILPLATPAFRLEWSLVKKSFVVGARALVTTAMLFAGYRGIMLLIHRDLGPGLLGCYAVAVPIAEILMHIPATLGAVLLNDAAAGEGSARQVAKVVRIHLITSGGLGCLMIAAAPWALRLLFGDKYEPSIAPLRILVPGYYFFGVWAVTMGYEAGRHAYPWPVVALSALSGVLTLGLASLWVPSSALAGAALASSVSALIVALMMTIIFVRGSEGQLRFRDLVPGLTDLKEMWQILRVRLKSA